METAVRHGILCSARLFTVLVTYYVGKQSTLIFNLIPKSQNFVWSTMHTPTAITFNICPFDVLSTLSVIFTN